MLRCSGDQAQLIGPERGLRRVASGELDPGTLERLLRCLGGDAEGVGRLLAALSLGDQPQGACLELGQLAAPPPAVASARRPDETAPSTPEPSRMRAGVIGPFGALILNSPRHPPGARTGTSKPW